MVVHELLIFNGKICNTSFLNFFVTFPNRTSHFFVTFPIALGSPNYPNNVTLSMSLPVVKKGFFWTILPSFKKIRQSWGLRQLIDGVSRYQKFKKSLLCYYTITYYFLLVILPHFCPITPILLHFIYCMNIY